MTDNLEAIQNAETLEAAAGLPWMIAPTSEDVLNIPGSVVVIQTEEDLGPKDADLPTVH